MEAQDGLARAPSVGGEHSGVGLSTGCTLSRTSDPLFGFSSGCYYGSMPPQHSARLSRHPSKVPNTIRKYRLALGLTQRELAALLGIRPATISEWERGLTCPSAEPLLKLAKTLSTLAESLYPQFYLRHSVEGEVIASIA